MRIGVLSDTHVQSPGEPLPAGLLRGLEGVERILHAGDILVPEVLQRLARIAPVDAVAGNCDSWAVREQLGEEKLIEVAGCRIGLFHGHLGPGADTPDRAFRRWADRTVDVIVFGHSHLPMAEWRAGRLLLNPGSPTEPRRAPWPSFALLRIDEDEPGPVAEIIRVRDG
jgi:putative phosphoesterase